MVFFGWNRSVPGRERLSAEHFGEFAQYLGGLQQAGAIQSFDVAFLDIHGGDMNGFFLIRGDNAQLDTLTASQAWVMHMLRAGLHMEGAGVVRGATGDLVMERMSQWVQSIP
jgi:DNA-binding LytR/AlgR family response regulator